MYAVGLVLGISSLLFVAMTSKGRAALVPSQAPAMSSTPANGVYQGELSFSEAEKMPPFPPAETSAISSSNGITIFWKANCGDIKSYTVYRRLSGKAYVKVFSRNSDPALEDNNAPGRYQFTDKRTALNQSYTYAVTVTSSLGAESDKSETETITLK